MNEQELLSTLPDLALAFMFVLCRTGTVVMLMPGLGEAEPPPMVRAGFALSLTLLLLPSVAPLIPKAAPGIGLVAMLAGELFAGLVLGWLARLPALALAMAGAIISYMTGLTSVLQPDPALGGQSAALSRALSLAVPVIVLSSGLYALPLSALAGSYQVIPPGGAIDGSATDAIQQAISASFALSIRLAAPFLLAGVVLQAGLGLLARLAPQLQAYSAAVPGQILGGVALLGVLSAPFLSTWTETLRAAWSVLPGS